MKNILLGIVLASLAPFSFCAYAQDADDNEESFILLKGIAYNVGTDLVGFADSYLRIFTIFSEDDEDYGRMPIEEQELDAPN